MNKFLDKISNWYLYGNFIFIVGLLSFGTYAIPRFIFSIKEFGLSQLLHGLLSFSLILYFIVLLPDCILKMKSDDIDIKMYFIMKFKSLPKDIISVVITAGYLFYAMYCTNYYTYLIPIFLLPILRIIKKINLKRITMANSVNSRD